MVNDYITSFLLCEDIDKIIFFLAKVLACFIFLSFLSTLERKREKMNSARSSVKKKRPIIFDEDSPLIFKSNAFKKRISSSFDYCCDLDNPQALLNFCGLCILRKCAAKFPRVQFVARK